MKASFLIAVFAVATLPGIPAAIASPVDSCDLGTKTIGELQYKLSRRAVEAVIRAAETGNDGGDRLRQLVTPMASFSLDSGDVSIPLGSGIAGLRMLVREMRAERSDFSGGTMSRRPSPTLAGRTRSRSSSPTRGAAVPSPLRSPFRLAGSSRPRDGRTRS